MYLRCDYEFFRVVCDCDTHFFMCYCFFFFKQKTAYEMRISDWSSDVCSSDLYLETRARRQYPDHQPQDQNRRHSRGLGEALRRDRRGQNLSRDAPPGGRTDRRAPARDARRRRLAAAQGRRILRLCAALRDDDGHRSEEHTSELQSQQSNSNAVIWL